MNKGITKLTTPYEKSIRRVRCVQGKMATTAKFVDGISRKIEYPITQALKV